MFENSGLLDELMVRLSFRPVQKLDCIDKGDLANEKAEGLRTA